MTFTIDPADGTHGSGAGFKGRSSTERYTAINGAALTASGQTTFSKEFPTGQGWRSLRMRFAFAVTATTAASAKTEGTLLAIKNITLQSDRGEIFCNLPGRALYKILNYRGTMYTGAAPIATTLATTTGTYYVNLPLPFADEALDRPEDTILDTARYQSVTMLVTMGGLSDLYSTVGDAVLAMTLTCEVERTYGALPPEARPFVYPSFNFRPPADAASTTTIDLEHTPDMSLKRLYVHSGTSATSGVPCSGTNADTIQDLITIQDQSRFIEFQRVHAIVQAGNAIDKGLAAVIAGLEVYDFVKDKSLASAVNTGDKSVFQYTWTNQSGVSTVAGVTALQETIRTLK